MWARYTIIGLSILISCSSTESRVGKATREAEEFWEDVAPYAAHIGLRNLKEEFASYADRIIDDKTDGEAYVGIGDCIIRSISTMNRGDWWHYDAFEPDKSFKRTQEMDEDIEYLMLGQAFISRGVSLGSDSVKARNALKRSRQVISLMLNKTPDSFRHPKDFVKIQKGNWAFDDYSKAWIFKRWNNKVFNAALQRATYPQGRYGNGEYGRNGNRGNQSANQNRVNVRIGR